MPKTHLTTYCHKMAGHAHNELFIHVFQDNLTGKQLNGTRNQKGTISHIERFGQVFLKTIKTHAEDGLESFDPPKYGKEKPGENYREYIARWKEMASQV